MYAITTYAPNIGPFRNAIARSEVEAFRIFKDMQKTYGPGYNYRIVATHNGYVLAEA